MAIAARAAEFPVMAAFELLMSHFEQLASELLGSSAAGSSPNVPPLPLPFPFPLPRPFGVINVLGLSHFSANT